MDEKQQIEELCKDVESIHRFFLEDDDYDYLDEYIAVKLHEKGYHKQSRGEWKQAYNSFPRYVCTNCNHLFNNKTFKYCPNCGAKMKGE